MAGAVCIINKRRPPCGCLSAFEYNATHSLNGLYIPKEFMSYTMDKLQSPHIPIFIWRNSFHFVKTFYGSNCFKR